MLVLILAYSSYVLSMAAPGAPVLPGNFPPAQPFPSNQKPLIVDAKAHALTVNGINPSKVHNTSFLNDVKWNMATFNKFINDDPRAKEQLNALLDNYGIIEPDFIGDRNTLALPNPAHILSVVEESLAIHSSFKEYLRKMLENVQQYLSRSSMLLAESVISMKRKIKQIIETMHEYEKTKSEVLKRQLSKKLVDLKGESEDAARRFEALKNWRKAIVSGVATNL